MGRIVLVRHGQASFGAADYDALSDRGAEQARTTGAALAGRGVRPTVLLQGRLRRHDQTTRALLDGAGWAGTPVESTEHWDEIDHLEVMRTYGETPEEQDPRAFQAAYERALRRWTTGPSAAPGHETFADLTGRVAEGLRRAADRAGRGQTAVVVTSAGPISVVCASLMHADLLQQDASAWLRWNAVAVNCALTTVVVGRQGTHLVSFNEHGHLHPDVVTYR